MPKMENLEINQFQKAVPKKDILLNMEEVKIFLETFHSQLLNPLTERYMEIKGFSKFTGMTRVAINNAVQRDTFPYKKFGKYICIDMQPLVNHGIYKKEELLRFYRRHQAWRLETWEEKIRTKNQ